MALNYIWDLWNKWNIQGFVILSISLQIFLILFAPLRKKIANCLLNFLLWLSYLMADRVAIFGIGLISHNKCNSATCTTEVDGVLQAFWASFLLLHLGGSDTITAFSLVDSSLWQRHLLNLVFEVCATIYVFVQIFPSDKSLMIPTILVFLAGVIKNVERTLALYLSSLPRLKEWVRPREQPSGHATLVIDKGNGMVEELSSIGNEYSDQNKAYLAESIAVKHAYVFFDINKVLLGDLLFTSDQREISRKYFYQVPALDALRVISIELQFMYEMLHTKALAIRSKWSYIFRFIAFTNVAIAFVLFNHLKKHRLSKLDVEITYSLLFGGIVLDVITLFMLVSSDWTVARIMWCNRGSHKLNLILHKLVSVMDRLRKHRFVPCEAEPNTSVAYEVLDTHLIFRRWSESISACNLLSLSLTESPRKIYKLDWGWGIIAFSKICSFPLKNINLILRVGKEIARACGLRKRVADTMFVSKNPFIKELWIFIFEEVKRKSEKLSDLTEVRVILETRSGMFLKSRLEEIDCENLLVYITKLSYGGSIIMWHIATEIWYNKEKQCVRDDKREFSKFLSDYMVYLLFNQSNVVSAVVGVAQFTLDVILWDLRYMGANDLEGLCAALFEKNSSGTSFDAGIRLAHEMERLGERKWEVMGVVWVEMLSYAASHIKGEAHVQVLRKGGELLAFVWLLMAHFGCLYNPEWGLFYGERDELISEILSDAQPPSL
ncbi:uncharacterized protein LOC115677069 [Syzygium oleosum]|uniref:uncharacterized protein LOC115677069 n=1 Tax=Syzygium oleosum TaxID=219896 RepID=UPI0024BBE782|nr:uncharacterized protein LOC115677069 [Syzygium oleosum]